MSMWIAINGFCLKWPNVLRCAFENDRTDVKIVAINDLAPVKTNVHLLRYDSMYGKFLGDITFEGKPIDIGRGSIDVSYLRDLSELLWGDINIVLECTRIFISKGADAGHLKKESKRFLVSAPATGADKTIVYGLNQSLLTKKDRVVSNTSCTTNCLALPASVTCSNISIKKGIVITFRSYNYDQPKHDRGHSDIDRAPCWFGSTWTLWKAWQRDNSYANAQCVLSRFNLWNHTRHSCRGIKRCNTIRI